MPAQNLDLNGELIIETGARWGIELQLPGDLSGAFLKGQIRKSIGGELLVQFEFSNIEYDEDLQVSSCMMQLRAGTTQLIPIPKSPAYWVYDVKLFPKNEDPIRILQGKVMLSPGVTD